MNIVKSRLNFSLEPLGLGSGKTKQDINDFIQQKKEMFLVELAQNVIQNRIENLDTKGRRKAQALKDSEMQLQSDDVKLLKFIEKDQNRNQTQWRTVAKYWRADFREDSKMKKPLINEKKRKVINQLIKNDHLTVRGIHNGMMERVVFSD